MTTTTRVRPEVMVNPSAASDRRRDLSTSSATLLSPCLVPSKHTKKDATPLSPQSMSNLTLLDAMGGHIGSDDDEARLLEEFSQSLRASMRTKKLSPTSDSRLQKEFNRALNATIQSTQSRKNMVLDTHLKPPNDASKTEHPDILSASPSKFVSLDEAIPVFWHPRVREASRSSSPAELFTSEELAFIEQARTRSFMANTSHSRPSNTNQPQSPTPSTAWENASTKAIHYDQSRSESRTESLNASLYVLSGSPARTHTAQTSPKSHSREEAGSPDHLRTGSPTNGKAHNRSSTGASSPYDPDYFPVEAQVQNATDDFSEFQVHTLSYSAKPQEDAMSSSSHAEMRSRSPSPSFNISGEHHKSPSLSLRSTDGVHVRSPSPSLRNSEHFVIMGLSPHRSGYSSPTIRNVRLGSGASERSASPEFRTDSGQGTQDARTLAFTALTSEQPQEIVHPSVVASPRRPKSPPLAVESLHPDQSSKSSPSPHHAVPNPNEELEQRLLLALDDLERHRTALSRTRSDLIARDAEIDKLKWERRRTEEDFLEEREGLLQKVHLGKVDIGRVEERLRKDGEERVREVEELKFKLNDTLSTIAALEKELELAQQQMYEVSQRQQQALTSGISGVEHSRLIELIKDLKAENGELKEMLQQEKTKNARSEEEFRMFSRKLRTLQDTNGELRNENETLRTELRVRIQCFHV
ncbi:hypothetical protein BC829DRAFT_406422 [Chytridium lagenaria]|nr:hypothetical protein BC829DRAFT_406422 [Chytridium lagenaria]